MSEATAPLHPQPLHAVAAVGQPSVLRVGLLGCGVVGSEVARILLDEAERISSAAGVKLELARVAVRHVDKARSVELPPGTVTDSALDIVSDPSIDLIIEVIGGIELPRVLLSVALRSGKSVVTANKELLASCGQALAETAEDSEVDLFFEASVGGAIPIVRALRDPLTADLPTRITGVINGTTNFILKRMEEQECDLGEALEEAQRLGYAEQDPTADIEGGDAAAKIAILASLAFEGWVSSEDVSRKGITSVTLSDLLGAKALGYSVKLVATAERPRGTIFLKVSPALVRRDSSLGSLEGALNAVCVESHNAGSLVFQGLGAGGVPSASAVVGDLVAAARNRLSGAVAPLTSRIAESRSSLSPVGVASRYFLRIEGAGCEPPLEIVQKGGLSVGHSVPLTEGEGVALVTEPTELPKVKAAVQILSRCGFKMGDPIPVLEVE